MSKSALFAGPAIRRLRKRSALTQAAMAARLSISPSYLNLLERNQRPLSARVIMRIVQEFDFDPRALAEDESIGGIDGLARRLSDERFAALNIDRDEIGEFLSSAPHVAAAFARLYDAGREDSRLDDDPLVQSRVAIERWRNHFPELDERAEALADELRLSRSDLGVALGERLREQHQIAVRVLPQDVLPDSLRRLDLHARQLQLSEMLSPAARNFQVAVQIAELEEQDAIADIASGSHARGGAAHHLFKRHLTAYFAAALLMPYGRFLRACDTTGYDLAILQRRFGVSFEQMAHRLTTMQRVGQRGLPFFMARLDRAGQFSKRFAGASGATILESEASCPLWIANSAFERPGETLAQTIRVDSVDAGPQDWFTMAQTVDGSGARGTARFVVVLGIETRLATPLAQARGLPLDGEGAQAIGLGCARCHRPACRQRSLPPRGVQLEFDRTSRGVTPFAFGKP